MSVTILFVCKANICRSPSAVALFRQRLRMVEQDALVSVRSAGIDAEPGRPWCPSAVRAVGQSTIDELELTHRVSCKLRQGMLERATLVVSADRQTSASVLRMLPSTRGRLFTMVESARLARFVLAGSETHSHAMGAADLVEIRPRPETASSTVGINWLVTEMNAARGQLPVRREHRSRWRRPKESPVSHDDIPDAHRGTGSADHTRTFAALTMSVDILADSVFAAANPTAGSRARL